MESGKKEVEGTLPDGTEIELQGEIFKCPEALFQPNKMNKESIGIHEAIYQSIINCDQQIKKDLYGGILLAGGSTMFKGARLGKLIKGLNKRLFKEISALAPSTMVIKVKAPQERKFSAWIGGSILTSLDSFKSLWITSKEFQEHGQSIIFRKSF